MPKNKQPITKITLAEQQRYLNLNIQWESRQLKRIMNFERPGPFRREYKKEALYYNAIFLLGGKNFRIFKANGRYFIEEEGLDAIYLEDYDEEYNTLESLEELGETEVYKDVERQKRKPQNYTSNFLNLYDASTRTKTEFLKLRQRLNKKDYEKVRVDKKLLRERLFKEDKAQLREMKKKLNKKSTTAAEKTFIRSNMKHIKQQLQHNEKIYDKYIKNEKDPIKVWKNMHRKVFQKILAKKGKTYDRYFTIKQPKTK